LVRKTGTPKSLFPLKGTPSGFSGLLRGILLCSLLLFGLVHVYQVVFPQTSMLQAAEASSFTFTAAGDHGWGSNTDASLASLQSSGASFHLALGDLGYSSDASGWCGYFKGQFSNILFITGNHDTDESGPGSLSPGYIEACPFTLSTPLTGNYGKNYYFDYPSSGPLARFILVAAGTTSSEVDGDYSQGTANYNFVAGAIDNARSQNTPWVIVGMHKGCIYAGDKGSCDIGQDFFDLLLAKRVDLILQAHAHIYERSHQLSCATAGTTEQGCIVDTDNSFAKGLGSVVVIDGTFGDGNRSVDPGDPEAGYFAELMDSDYGFVKYTITPDRVDSQFVSSTGSYSDSFSITGSGSSPPPSQPPASTPQMPDLWLLITGVALGSVAGIAIFGIRSRKPKASRGLSSTGGEGQSHRAGENGESEGSRSSSGSRRSSRNRLALFLLCTIVLSGGVIGQRVVDNAVGAASGSSFSFGAAGDWGYDADIPWWQQNGGDFVLVVGDLGYTSNAADWCGNYVSQIGKPIIWVVGNHETDDSGPGRMYGSGGYIANCPPPAGFNFVGDWGIRYYFDYPTASPNTRIIAIAAAIGGSEIDGNYNIGTENYDWTSARIDEAKSLGYWIIVMVHKNCISTGSKSCGEDAGSVDVWNLLLSKKVDLVFQGHDHNYQRTHQLGCGPPDGFQPGCIVDSDSTFTRGAGTVLVINGNAGACCYGVSGSDPDAGYFAIINDGGTVATRYTVSATAISANADGYNGFNFDDAFTIGGSGEPPPLSADFTFTPSNPYVGQTVTFTGIASGGTSPYSYSWTFGDGATGTGITISHSYSSTGLFTALVTVTDGASSIASSLPKTIAINLSPPLNSSFTYSPSNPFTGQTVTFTGSAVGGQSPYTFTWDFGDSSTAQGNVISHSYANEGTYAATLTVTDGSNTQVTFTTNVIVDPRPLLIQTTFSITDPAGADVTSSLTFEVWEGNTLATTTNPADLDPSKAYELRIAYQTYEIHRHVFTPQNIVQTIAYIYPHQSAPDAFIAFNSPIDLLIIHEESNSRLNFHAEGTSPPYNLVVKVPKAPVTVTKDGASVQFTFDPGLNVVVIVTPTLSVWDLSFEAPSQPPPPPPPPPDNQPGGNQCFLTCQPLPGSFLSTIWMLLLGGIMGLTLSLAMLTARAHSRLNRARRSDRVRRPRRARPNWK
jgi:chitodextrinase